MQRMLRRVTAPLALIIGLALGTMAVSGAPTAGREAGPEPAVTTPVRTVAQVDAVPVARRAAGPAKNVAIRYELPALSGVNEFIVGFPRLPKGIYLASFSLVVQMQVDTDGFNCYLDRPGTSASTLLAFAGSRGPYRSVNASGVISTLTKSVKLHCSAEGTVARTRLSPDFRSYIDFVGIDASVTRQATTTIP